MKNHLGQYECKLCLTLHMNEGNYLAHTQGKRHQYNLGRRAVSYNMHAVRSAPPLTVLFPAPGTRGAGSRSPAAACEAEGLHP